jgi:hypothetical protein
MHLLLALGKSGRPISKTQIRNSGQLFKLSENHLSSADSIMAQVENLAVVWKS